MNDYACTMMLGLVSERLVGVAHVGDGCVVAGDGDDWRLLSEPDNGEFANETRFLTNPRNLPRVTVVSGSDISCVAVYHRRVAGRGAVTGQHSLRTLLDASVPGARPGRGQSAQRGAGEPAS